ncbi:NAD-dependent epimerase/dehydratase family protein [Streptomyces sp. HK10]|uniref:NAD-dependent epimerase/dehydratase family protein n=1 Tax=Streptomyces sp. HK10 TaxID=3373255 RepID=UPI0037490CE4
MQNVLVTGASGFIGRHVVRAALSKPSVRIRLAGRKGPEGPGGGRTETVRADLADPPSLRGLCEGTDAVVHCASRVGGDEQTLRAVNDAGTRALVDEALRHGVRRFVYVSTAAVYGRGPFREADVDDLPLRPGSATSVTRASAERHVLAAGGTVLRPHLVYGTGDRWVIPGLAGLLRFVGSGVRCSSLHSAVDAAALAEAAVAAAFRGPEVAGVFHVNHPRPVPASALIAMVLESLDLPSRTLLPAERVRARISGSPEALHHFDMLAVDHWFRSDRVWQVLGCEPGPAPGEGISGHMPWYGRLLRQEPGTGAPGPNRGVLPQR